MPQARLSPGKKTGGAGGRCGRACIAERVSTVSTMTKRRSLLGMYEARLKRMKWPGNSYGWSSR